MRNGLQGGMLIGGKEGGSTVARGLQISLLGDGLAVGGELVYGGWQVDGQQSR